MTINLNVDNFYQICSCKNMCVCAKNINRKLEEPIFMMILIINLNFVFCLCITPIIKPETKKIIVMYESFYNLKEKTITIVFSFTFLVDTTPK